MNIFITGASRGIGFDTAKLLASNPDNQLFVLSRNESALKELAQDNVTILPVDLTKIEKEDLVPVFAQCNHLDLLINNAGYLINAPFEHLSMDDWMQCFNVNLFGPVRLIKHLLPYLKKGAKSHVLNISSMGGFQGSAKFSGLSAYSASKAALINLTEMLAQELSETSVSFNALALGAVQTEMLKEAFPGYKAPITSENMAAFVSWFGQHGHEFFNGKVLPVSVSTP